MPDDLTMPPRTKHHLPTLTPALDAGVTMTTIEIADRTKKQHRHVLADVRKMFTALGLHSAEFLAQYTDARGRALPCFVLPKREILILTAGYSIPLRASVIDRLDELERVASVPAQPVIPSTYADALRLAADNADEADRQRSIADDRLRVIEVQAPAVAAVARLSASTDSITVTEAAKNLKMKAKDLFAYLEEKGWIFRRGSGLRRRWQATQRALDQGWMEHDAFPYLSTTCPTEAYSIKITPTGILKLTGMLVNVQLEFCVAAEGAV